MKKKWPKNYVSHRFPSKANVTYFKGVLNVAGDEKPIQTALASNPALLRCLTNNTRHFWCFDRPSLGGKYIPDYLLCNHTSAGFQWTYIELESPTKQVLIKSGLPSAKLREAMGQIDDWRIWLRKNIAYAQNYLGFTDIDAECMAYVIIGKRAMINSKLAMKYRELSKHNLKIITYDRFIEMIEV